MSAGGLKQQWDVDDPAAAGSDEQARRFQAAFEAQMAAINGSLQDTAVTAEAARHEPLAGRRDALFPAYQAAHARIDPGDPARAQGAIEQLLADAKALAADASALQQAARQALQAWQAREAAFDEAVQQIEALEDWQEPQAAALRGSAEQIQQHANERRYDAACTELDALLQALKPVHDEYLRQKEAQPAFEALLAETGARLEPLKAAERPSQPMTAKAGEADAAIADARGLAERRDFVAALDRMQATGAVVDELERMAGDAERARFLADVGGIDALVQPPGGTPFVSQQAEWTAITALQERIAPTGDGGDYAAANGLLAELRERVDAFRARHDELEQRKAGYQAAFEPLRPRLAKVAEASDPQLGVH